MSKESKCHNILLLSLVEETIRITNSFEEINFKHIYRERTQHECRWYLKKCTHAERWLDHLAKQRDSLESCLKLWTNLYFYELIWIERL